jgi:uncharacterized membrane protein
MRARTIALLAVVILSNVIGNFALGWGMKNAPHDSGLVLSLFQPAVIAGILLLILWTLTRMKLLGQRDLSWVLPVTSVGYVLTVVMGAAFLHELVTVERWTGAVLIVAGAALVGLEENLESRP